MKKDAEDNIFAIEDREVIVSLRKSWQVIKSDIGGYSIVRTPAGIFSLKQSPKGELLRLTSLLDVKELINTD